MFEYRAEVFNVVDGDTVDAVIDLGLRVTIEMRIRLFGVDTPERGRTGFHQATAFLIGLVIAHPVTVRTVKPFDKYGRWLASLSTDTCPDVAQAIIDAGLGVPYFGGLKTPPVT